MKNKDELNEILDRALSSYVEAEPLTGLENRILKRAQTAQSSRPLSLWLTFALGTLTLCGILLLSPKNQSTLHQEATKYTWSSPPTLETTEQPIKSQIEKAVTRTVTVAKRRRAAKQLPKLTVFPAPSPMTQEERTLMAFVQNHPDDAIKTFSDLQRQMNNPIQIQPIEIRPLDNGEVQ